MIWEKVFPLLIWKRSENERKSTQVNESKSVSFEVIIRVTLSKHFQIIEKTANNYSKVGKIIAAKEKLQHSLLHVDIVVRWN